MVGKTGEEAKQFIESQNPGLKVHVVNQKSPVTMDNILDESEFLSMIKTSSHHRLILDDSIWFLSVLFLIDYPNLASFIRNLIQQS